MNRKQNNITVFEHETIRFDKGTKRITHEQFNELSHYYGERGLPYFDLCYNGIVFNEYVGVIQVGKTLIEVLPKADKVSDTLVEENKWRNILIDMLRVVGSFDIKTPSSSNLKIKPNTILDLYFDLFIREMEYLLHNGLIKRYHKKEDNVTALKGRILFAQHLQQNLIHQERFYVSHTNYDVEHQLHFILFKTIRLVKQISTNGALQSRIGNLLLNFPEMPDIKVSESTFDKLVFSRKTTSYKKSIEIARLILLQYHPDLSTGRNHVLALMFDMNKLWEQFVVVSLRKNQDHEITISALTSKYFWKPTKGNRSAIRPDIVINKDKENCTVLDTKWKNLNGNNPSPDDLRQMYVYHEYYNAKRVALVYPGSEFGELKGTFYSTTSEILTDKECSIIKLAIPSNARNNKSLVKTWQEDIKLTIENWMNGGGLDLV